jgi:hypothetical protein
LGEAGLSGPKVGGAAASAWRFCAGSNPEKIKHNNKLKAVLFISWSILMSEKISTAMKINQIRTGLYKKWQSRKRADERVMNQHWPRALMGNTNGDLPLRNINPP